MTDHAEWMRIALAEAARAEERGEVPVGAVIVRDGVLLATGYNQPITQQDPTAHAEIMALRAACQREGNYRLPGVTLYVTLEPCMMCLGAMLHARVRCLVYGASDTRVGMASKIMQLK